METLKYNFTKGDAKLSTPPYNEQEALAFWSAYDTPSINEKKVEKTVEKKAIDPNQNFGGLLGAVARAGKPEKPN